MGKLTYTPDAVVCTTKISFDIENGMVKNLVFTDGCDGNAQAIGRLCEGMSVEQVIRLLKGIDCDGKGTSCADQLTKALEKALR
jgi:uncharacterized protein (TIGR03905 family)